MFQIYKYHGSFYYFKTLMTTGKLDGKGSEEDNQINAWMTQTHDKVETDTDLIRDSDDSVRWQTMTVHAYR
uniref:Uncharacterized protein n=1 Tax=Arion vulgaris TaxID=1028688 RepID=A0A0B7BGW1_9EUPU